MTTGHELGAAFGVSLVSAVALGSGASGFVGGYGQGAIAGAILAAALALIALVAVPRFRPVAATQVAIH
jgi:hypothetical protein